MLNEKARRNDMGKDNAQALVIIEREVREEILEGCAKSRSCQNWKENLSVSIMIKKVT